VAVANVGNVTIGAPASTVLHPGDKIQLTATVRMPNGSVNDKFPVKWSTSSPADDFAAPASYRQRSRSEREAPARLMERQAAGVRLPAARVQSLASAGCPNADSGGGISCQSQLDGMPVGYATAGSRAPVDCPP
jgi:hypothetical protein